MGLRWTRQRAADATQAHIVGLPQIRNLQASIINKRRNSDLGVTFFSDDASQRPYVPMCYVAKNSFSTRKTVYFHLQYINHPKWFVFWQARKNAWNRSTESLN